MNFVGKIKEALKDPKKKSITLLVIYALFFVVVFILLNMGESRSNYIAKEEEKIEYKYTYKVFENEEQLETFIDNQKYKYEVIEKLIENSDSETKYKDSNKILYNISASKYFNILGEEDYCNDINCSVISISFTQEKLENANNVIIDLSNYYEYKYIIEIMYYIEVED